MSPTIVMKNGDPLLALGSPGGSMIITTVLQTLLNRFDFGMTLPQAIAAPRASQRNTAQTTAEQPFIDQYGTELRTRFGQSFSSTTEIGSVTGVEFLPDGDLEAAAEPVRRGGGWAAVVCPRGETPPNARIAKLCATTR
jgi:gamma-glutamyltranspeptidase/glutathione hydrolase